MARVRLSVSLQLTQLATAALVAAISVSLTDSTGAAHTASINPADVTNDGTGMAVAVVDLDDVADGDFSGSVQAVDTTSANVGDAASFTGTVPAGGNTGGLQWIPISVTSSVSPS